MKILLSGYHNPHYPTITEYIERAIEALGHELIVFNDRDHLFPGRLRRRTKILQKISLGSINLSLIKLVHRTRPDIVIITGGHRISPITIKRLGGEDVRTVLWTTDAPDNFQPIINSGSFYSFIFCQGTEAVEIFSKQGLKAHWLPMACEPKIHKPIRVFPNERRKFAMDIAFVGSYYRSREAILKQLTDFNLGIWGPGWHKAAAGPCLKARIQGAHTVPSEWEKIYGASKIVLATHYQDPQGRFPVYQASPRIFEAMACGGFVISDNQRDVFALFRDGEHLVSYDGPDDLVAKIKFYLSHPSERKKIAEQGRQEVLDNHQYVHRIEKLLSIVGAG